MPATNERTSTMLPDAKTGAPKRRLREYRYSLPLRPKAMSISASEPSAAVAYDQRVVAEALKSGVAFAGIPSTATARLIAPEYLHAVESTRISDQTLAGLQTPPRERRSCESELLRFCRVRVAPSLPNTAPKLPRHAP